jgi:putative methylase
MGEFAQKRLIRKLDLELFLGEIASQPTPQARLEQYTISESIAANMLYIASYNNNDIIGKTVLDLGCGTGRLALGAAYLGAEAVVGVDIDRQAIRTASDNSRKVGLANYVQWILANINAINGCFDTVLQNPPFGVQTREADRVFLRRSLEVGNKVYSLHNHPEHDSTLIRQLKGSQSFMQVQPSPFLKSFIAKNGGVVKAVYAMLMSIPRMFDFHTKSKHEFVVDLYVAERM